MYDRLVRGASALLVIGLVFGAASPTCRAAENDAAAAEPAVIELRKTFRPVSRAGRRTSRSVKRGGEGTAPDAGGEERGSESAQLEGLAAALGETLLSTGSLHLPGVGAAGVVLQGSRTPILETAAGRRLIIDRDHLIAPEVAAGIARRWPGYSVLQPAPGEPLRDLIGGALDAAGYYSVLRSVPLTMGRGVTLRLRPDFVVLRSEDDLLTGETRAISVHDDAETLPPELRELAGQHRVRVVELTPAGAAVGVDRAPWRDAPGRVITVETTRLTSVIEEVAVAVGLTAEHQARPAGAQGKPGGAAVLRIASGEGAVLVVAGAEPADQVRAPDEDQATIRVGSAADLPGAIGALLERFTVPAIGPSVDFYRASAPDAPRRFVINVPGWLAESGGRKLLITGTAPPPLVRLYLTREGIDIFEYRIH